MAFLILDQAPVFLARRVGFTRLEDMQRMLDRAHACLTQGPGVLVYDSGAEPAGRPDARARQLTAEWMSEHEAFLLERCLGVDFSFPTPLSRGVLTAIFWLKAPPFPHRVHPTCRAALRSALARLTRDDTPGSRTKREREVDSLLGQLESRRTG